MRIHGFVPVSCANGPGRRSVLWLQGCRLRCPSCWNPAGQPFTGTPTDGQEIVERVLALRQDGMIEGLTFSGGEPMQQAPSVLGLIERLRYWGAVDLSFGMFTGYTLGELERGRYSIFEGRGDKTTIWRTIRCHLDFAVMGRYNANAPVALPLRTSRNQQLHLFSGRYRERDFGEQVVEISIAESGNATVTGFPVLGDLL